MVNYYRNFIQNASSILHPLHYLLQKNIPWNWTKKQDEAVLQIKRDLASDLTLAHFDANAKLILTVDASPSGLGAILSQVGTDGLERPVAYGSRALIRAKHRKRPLLLYMVSKSTINIFTGNPLLLYLERIINRYCQFLIQIKAFRKLQQIVCNVTLFIYRHIISP